MSSIVPIILSGGAGSRLWPSSRSMYPKQLLPLTSERTMLQETVLRADGVVEAVDDSIVVCNEVHRFLVAQQLEQIGRDPRILVEPDGRNTAPAVALAAFLTAEKSPTATLLVLPADHVIARISAFEHAVSIGSGAAKMGKLVTFGVVPTRPETGYGYIEAVKGTDGLAKVKRFVEKPNLSSAKRFVNAARYFWNSGIFMFTAQSYLDALKKHSPSIYSACERSIADRESSGIFIRPNAKSFYECPSDSLDYAIFEKTDNAVMVPLDAGWSDVGSWTALHELGSVDEDGNSTSGDVVLQDCSDTFVRAENRLVAAVGIEGIIIVETRDVVLVANQASSQKVKFLVDKLNERGRNETQIHRQVFRPWGNYTSLENADGFQVKELVVNPGADLSLQKHARRSEHWVVVRGKAKVTKNAEIFDLCAGESTYIDVGDVHRISNPFEEPVHIIEVQCGDYLGEDDIERIDDKYGRAGTNK